MLALALVLLQFVDVGVGVAVGAGIAVSHAVAVAVAVGVSDGVFVAIFVGTVFRKPWTAAVSTKRNSSLLVPRRMIRKTYLRIALQERAERGPSRGGEVL